MTDANDRTDFYVLRHIQGRDKCLRRDYLIGLANRMPVSVSLVEGCKSSITRIRPQIFPGCEKNSCISLTENNGL